MARYYNKHGVELWPVVLDAINIETYHKLLDLDREVERKLPRNRGRQISSWTEVVDKLEEQGCTIPYHVFEV